MTEHTTPPDDAQGADAHINRGVLDKLLEDVGPQNAELVIDAFAKELQFRAAALDKAADKIDSDSMAHAAHILKSTAASFGASELSELSASIEQSARAGQTGAVVAAMAEFRELAKASGEELDAIRTELFGSTAE
jgi:two-component system phosphorelay protein LuxU